VTSILTPAEQALLLIDIVVTEAALLVWALWSLEQHKVHRTAYRSWRRYVDAPLRGLVSRTMPRR
jgi:hypothetical protein